MLASTFDILRETQLSQFYRYEMDITDFSGFQMCGYVGDTSGFKTDRKPVVHSRYLHFSI
jgi:hypothetical protein